MIKEGGDYSEFKRLQKNPNFEEIAREFTDSQGEWQRMNTISNAFLNRGDLIEINKVWFYFISYVIKPSKHVSIVRQDRTILLYALINGFEMNVGRIVEESIFHYEHSKFSGNIPHPSLIIVMCIKGDVKFNEVEEERSPKAFPLTLPGVLKAPVESE